MIRCEKRGVRNGRWYASSNKPCVDCTIALLVVESCRCEYTFHATHPSVRNEFFSYQRGRDENRRHIADTGHVHRLVEAAIVAFDDGADVGVEDGASEDKADIWV